MSDGHLESTIFSFLNTSRIDNITSTRLLFFMKEKSKVGHISRKFNNMVQTQFEIKILVGFLDIQITKYKKSERDTWKTLMSFSSPLRLISKPLSSANVPSSLKTAYRFLIKIPSSLEAGRIIACRKEQSNNQY